MIQNAGRNCAILRNTIFMKIRMFLSLTAMNILHVCFVCSGNKQTGYHNILQSPWATPKEGVQGPFLTSESGLHPLPMSTETDVSLRQFAD